MKFARLKHDHQVKIRELDDGYNGEYPYPETKVLSSTPAGKRKDDIAYTEAMLAHLAGLQHTKALALKLTQIGQGQFNRAGNEVFVEQFGGQIPIFDLAKLPAEPKADPISSGGNLVNVLEDLGRAVKVETTWRGAAPPPGNWFTHPWLYTKHTSVDPRTGAVGLLFGDDAFYPNYRKNRAHLFVQKEWIEYFPDLPADVVVRTGVKVRSAPDERLDNRVGALSPGARVRVLEYAPRGSNVWGRIGDDRWICLLYTVPGNTTPSAFQYYTSWRMETTPPYVRRRERPGEKELVVSDPKPKPPVDIKHSALMGKGMYLWLIYRVLRGDAEAIAEMAQAAGLSHVLIKVADGRNAFNVKRAGGSDAHMPFPDGHDYAAHVADALQRRGIQAWGWQYIYGHYPEKEAEIAIQRTKALKLDGFVVNAEKEFKAAGMEKAARTYMQRLRGGVDVPLGFSSYRYPSYHRPLPFEAFLEHCDINMPQVYWVQSTNPGAQLLKSLREYEALSVRRPFFPTGAAYKEHGWQATPGQVQEFLEAVELNGLAGCNFWEWYYATLGGGELWDVVAEYPWAGAGEQDEEPAELPPGAGEPMDHLSVLARLRLALQQGGWI